MDHRTLRVAVVGLALGLAGNLTLGAQARERIAFVSVVDRSTGQARPELAVTDLTIREDGASREILRVTKATGPFPIAVLVDTSAGAEPVIPDLRRALAAFIKVLGETGPVAIIGFGDRATVLADYTSLPDALAAGIGRVFAQPGSAATLIEAVSETAAGLSRRESERSAVVVVSAGTPEQSTVHFTRALSRLTASGATLHAVTLAPPGRTLFDDRARQRDQMIDRGVRQTGGVRRDIVSSQAFTPALTAVADVLAHQFRVTYARPESLIPPETFVVAAASPTAVAYGGQARGVRP